MANFGDVRTWHLDVPCLRGRAVKERSNGHKRPKGLAEKLKSRQGLKAGQSRKAKIVEGRTEKGRAS